jgi:hypothetical protein
MVSARRIFSMRFNRPISAARKGRRTVALKRFPHRFAGYPLKVVYREEEGEILIVTAYPFKKAYWR